MNKEIAAIIRKMKSVNTGQPWFGRAAFVILDEVDPAKAMLRPGNAGHSMTDLIYHMNTWADFTLKRIEGDKIKDMGAFEKLDWRKIDPRIHSWKKGLKEFKKVQQEIMRILQTKDDAFLEQKVDYRTYNYRFLLEGMIQHTIYHLGQIAYLHKMLT
jgi:uncharacterized damage-inducible protein DinB